jgi:hypothetical protein
MVAAGPFAVQLGRPRGDDWVHAASLLEPGSPLLEERLVAFGKRLGTSLEPLGDRRCACTPARRAAP